MHRKGLQQIKREVEMATRIVKIPETIIKKLKPHGPRFIKVERPKLNVENSGKKAIERGFQKHPYEADDPELQQWLAEGGNYGILARDGLIIIETDNEETTKKLEEINTLTIRSGSGRGLHFIFMSNVTENGMLFDPHNPKNNLGNIQVNKKYVVGAGCGHNSGGTYKIKNDAPIAWINKEKIEKIFGYEEIEGEKINYVVWTGQKRKQLTEQSKLETEQVGAKIPLKDLIDMSELIMTTKGEYQGSHPLHGSMTGQNFCVNLTKNVWHCFRCNSGGGGLMWIAVENGLIECHEAQKGALTGAKFTKALKLASAQGFDVQFYDEELNPDVRRFFEKDKKGKQKFIPAYLAKEIMGEFAYATRKKDDVMFRYVPERGFYEIFAESHLKKQILDKLGKHTSISRQRETTNIVKVSTYRKGEEAPENLIVLGNGMLDIDTGKLEPFSPDHFILNGLNVNYDPKAKCPKFLKFLNEIVTKGDATILQEFFGYILLRSYKFQKCLLFVGGGANGKSTLLEVIRTLIGDDNVSNEPLQTLVVHRFSVAQLYGKLVNIYADLPAIALKETGMFKQLFGDTLSGEFKFRDKFNFRNYAKLLFSCNKVPKTPDDTDAFFRRWILINFPNQFLANDPRTDVNLLQKLTTEEELSGILNWMIEGLKRLLKNERFTRAKSAEETRRLYMQASDPIKAFVEECLEQSAGSIVPKQELFEAFVEYCAHLNLPAVTRSTFTKRLHIHCQYALPTKTWINNQQVRAWVNVKLVKYMSKSGQNGTLGTEKTGLSSVGNLKKYKEVNF